jgi:PEGA domain-containing protein
MGFGYFAPLFPGYGYGGSYDSLVPFDEYSADSLAPMWYSAEPPLPVGQVSVAAPSGNIRLVVEPSTAQVFVDGYYVGTVDDFRNTLAGLNIDAGRHRLEFRADGYEPLALDVKIEANVTITYRAALRRLQP